LSSLPLEIASKKLPSQLFIRCMDDGQKFELSTIGELREFLLTQGLDITTTEAMDWGTEYPHAAADITRICELEQQLADLKASQSK
jgi:hypothetical protein